ncbi:hypothetical protein Bca4012_032537 [Brassica carinata]
MITHLKSFSPIISYHAIIFSYQSSSFITYSILISRSLKLVVCRNGFKLTTITMTSPPPLWVVSSYGCAPEVKVDIAEMRRRCYEPETEVLRTRDGGGGRCGSEQGDLRRGHEEAEERRRGSTQRSKTAELRRLV